MAQVAAMNAQPATDPEQALIEFAIECQHDPLLWAKHAYPWGSGELEGKQLRAWQASVLDHIGKKLRNPASRHQPIKVAIASGHGIGKSACMSIIADWGMSTFPKCRAVVTAHTETQLRTKLMVEMAKWRRLSLTSHWFDTDAMGIKSRDKQASREWRLDATPWSKTSAVGFQGLHNEGKRLLILMDECSEIERVIWEAVDGALTDADTEIILVAFGNPTKPTGRFAECFTGADRFTWARLNIDSRHVEGTNKEYLNGIIERHGEDSDYARVRVRGLFPQSGDRQLIPSDVVEAAATREVPADFGAPVIMGVDVARHGSNQSVIVVRHGRDGRSFQARKFRGVSTTTLVGEIILAANSVQPDAIFVDGGGVGGGVVDQLRQTGYGALVREVQSGSQAGKKDRYYNKRAEMWGEMAEWLRVGAIENDRELLDDLKAPERDWKREQLIVESKDDMEARGIASPDHGDALAHTFAGPVARKDMPFLNRFKVDRPQAVGANFDVFGS